MAMAIAMTMAHFSRSGEYLWKNEDQKRDTALLHGAGTRLGVVVKVPSPQLLFLSRFLFFLLWRRRRRVGREWGGHGKVARPLDGRTDGRTYNVVHNRTSIIHYPQRKAAAACLRGTLLCD